MEAAGYCLLRCQQQLSEELQKHFFQSQAFRLVTACTDECLSKSWFDHGVTGSTLGYTQIAEDVAVAGCTAVLCKHLRLQLQNVRVEVMHGVFWGITVETISVPCKAVEILPLTLAMQGFHPLCFFLLLLCFTKLCIVWDSSKIAFIKLTERLEGSRKD